MARGGVLSLIGLMERPGGRDTIVDRHGNVLAHRTTIGWEVTWAGLHHSGEAILLHSADAALMRAKLALQDANKREEAT